MVMSTNSLAHVKARLSAYVDEVEATHERVVITRNGTPAAVLISPDDLASLEETVMLLSDPEAMAEIAEARSAIAAGNVIELEALALRPKG
jgi:antitoxin YefM